MTGADLRVGDHWHGELIISLSRMQVPAKVLHESVAIKHPEGLPAWSAVISCACTKSRTIPVTIFHGEELP